MASASTSDSASTCFRCFQVAYVCSLMLLMFCCNFKIFEHTRSRFPLFI
ncbi:hypothetical protein MtrunA17_Chr2g0332041 [Medicago truncatula]|uniref:Transmembrane protein n=1 Tax=Medicago truncatula TaxID=3880 RepID=A0A396JGL2_MEDTR|nr:hypothetical protein MtrunA17_Chr2g0332041 [Medicago truncatula]